jgi:hypothetical protein
VGRLVGDIVRLVIGSLGDEQIQAEGKTAVDTWHEALGQAVAIGILSRGPRPVLE